MLSFLGSETDEERLIKASQTLYDYVYLYVSSTNTIFRILNQHLGTHFPIISVTESLSLKENLQLLVSSLKEMQTVVETEAKDVKHHIGQQLYAKIAGPITSLQEKIAVVKDLYENYKGVLGGICGPFIAVLLKHGNLSDSIESAIHQLVTSPALSLQVADLINHNDLTKILPTTDNGSIPSRSTAQQTGPLNPSTSFSLPGFIQAILQGQTTKNSLKIAADYLEEAVRVLKPSCELFQCIVKLVEVCISLVPEKVQ